MAYISKSDMQYTWSSRRAYGGIPVSAKIET